MWGWSHSKLHVRYQGEAPTWCVQDPPTPPHASAWPTRCLKILAKTSLMSTNSIVLFALKTAGTWKCALIHTVQFAHTIYHENHCSSRLLRCKVQMIVLISTEELEKALSLESLRYSNPKPPSIHSVSRRRRMLKILLTSPCHYVVCISKRFACRNHSFIHSFIYLFIFMKYFLLKMPHCICGRLTIDMAADTVSSICCCCCSSTVHTPF